ALSSSAIVSLSLHDALPISIGINMTTYVGHITAGFLGGIVATIGLVTPSIIIILIIGRFLTRFRDNPYVDSVFYCLRPASTALIDSACFSVLWMYVFDFFYLIDTF